MASRFCLGKVVSEARRGVKYGSFSVCVACAPTIPPPEGNPSGNRDVEMCGTDWLPLVEIGAKSGGFGGNLS